MYKEGVPQRYAPTKSLFKSWFDKSQHMVPRTPSDDDDVFFNVLET